MKLVLLLLAMAVTSIDASSQDCNADSGEVCGEDMITYQNECHASHRGIAVSCKGTCPCGCECSQQRRQVCGQDDKTYWNECFAKCA
ncbi:ovomucoid-like [Mytilus trossulus]|uniref:ovomucoid-like n=1 Tax=Mytilus trossulus TaxID=6551 RepID=UPI0030059E15